jgi:aromatic-L-amino-acid decarboxylase
MNNERAEFKKLSPRLTQLGEYLDQYLRFEHDDAMCHLSEWRNELNRPLPQQGIGIDQVVEELGNVVIPNGSQIPSPGCSAFITTGAANIGVLANLSALVAAPQRIGIHAFNYLEELSLQWLADLFELPAGMKGVYSSGGSVANLVALGAARQWAFEQIGIDPASDGMTRPCRIYASSASHHTIHRAAAVLGIGRKSVITIKSDSMGRMIPACLEDQLEMDSKLDDIPVAVVANAGTTSTGAIDHLHELGAIAKKHSVWFHVDGAYGLPGILDERVSHLYRGLSFADSVIVDPHKWLGAPVGIGATFVRDRSILYRAFTQGASDYLEGACSVTDAQHSMDDLGIPYHDFGVELSAPSRGVVVWALIREIGKQGLAERIRRHNDMASDMAKIIKDHPNLELVQEPTLSICCFRYINDDVDDLNELNTRIHRQLVHNSQNIPSTGMINGKLVIRPCFIGARASWQQAQNLIDEVLAIGRQLAISEKISNYS